MIVLRPLVRLIGLLWLLALALVGLRVALYCLDGLVGLGSARPDRLAGLGSVRRSVGRLLDQLAAPGSLAWLSLLCGIAAVLVGLLLLVGLLRRARERLVLLELDAQAATSPPGAARCATWSGRWSPGSAERRTSSGPSSGRRDAGPVGGSPSGWPTREAPTLGSSRARPRRRCERSPSRSRSSRAYGRAPASAGTECSDAPADHRAYSRPGLPRAGLHARPRLDRRLVRAHALPARPQDRAGHGQLDQRLPQRLRVLHQARAGGLLRRGAARRRVRRTARFPRARVSRFARATASPSRTQRAGARRGGARLACRPSAGARAHRRAGGRRAERGHERQPAWETERSASGSG